MREALRRYLVQLAAEDEVASWERNPLTDDEQALAAIADWGAAEDSPDWSYAAR